jgi:hypothetical protein
MNHDTDVQIADSQNARRNARALRMNTGRAAIVHAMIVKADGKRNWNDGQISEGKNDERVYLRIG